MKTRTGQYPPDWPAIAARIKRKAGNRCERCGHANDVQTGHVLTVHHLDGDKSNCLDWNLAALCQRCHLRVQAKVDFMQDYFFPHSPWMLKHVLAHNLWALQNGKPLLTVAEPCDCEKENQKSDR